MDRCVFFVEIGFSQAVSALRSRLCQGPGNCSSAAKSHSSLAAAASKVLYMG